MPSEYVVGVDPHGTHLGLAVLQVGLPAQRAYWLDDVGCYEEGQGWLADQVQRALGRAKVPSREPVRVTVERVPYVNNIERFREMVRTATHVEDQVRRRWPGALILEMSPGRWKKAVGMKGNAPKHVIRATWEERGGPEGLPQDAIDAAFLAEAGAGLSVQVGENVLGPLG